MAYEMNFYNEHIHMNFLDVLRLDHDGRFVPIHAQDISAKFSGWPQRHTMAGTRSTLIDSRRTHNTILLHRVIDTSIHTHTPMHKNMIHRHWSSWSKWICKVQRWASILVLNIYLTSKGSTYSACISIYHIYWNRISTKPNIVSMCVVSISSNADPKQLHLDPN